MIAKFSLKNHKEKKNIKKGKKYKDMAEFSESTPESLTDSSYPYVYSPDIKIKGQKIL